MLGVGAGLVFRAGLVDAQIASSKLRRVGVLSPSTPAKDDVVLKPFFEQMRQLGWIEGSNIVYDNVYADDQVERLRVLAAELVARQPDLIFAPPTAAAVAAKRATQTIPIVFAAVVDPVAFGLVTSLAHPGGNATGVSNVGDLLSAKRIELLHEILPAAKRLGFLVQSVGGNVRAVPALIEPVVSALGLTIVYAEHTSPTDFDTALVKLAEERVDAIFPSSDIAFSRRAQLFDVANRHRIPVVGYRAQMADDGALFAYGPSLAGQFRRSAALVDKVLRGAKPAEVPVEQPAEYEFVVNLKIARMLGITVPHSILIRADKVID